MTKLAMHMCGGRSLVVLRGRHVGPRACPDASLVALAQRGDREAFSELAERHRLRIRRLVRSRISNLEDAADIEQDVLVRAWMSLTELTDLERFGAWLNMIARHACIDAVRRKARVKFLSVDEPLQSAGRSLLRELPDPDSDPSDRFETEELTTAYRQALGSLTQQARWALVMREAHGLSMEEIARRIHGTVGSAKSLIYRARRKVEETLRPHLAA